MPLSQIDTTLMLLKVLNVVLPQLIFLQDTFINIFIFCDFLTFLLTLWTSHHAFWTHNASHLPIPLPAQRDVIINRKKKEKAAYFCSVNAFLETHGELTYWNVAPLLLDQILCLPFFSVEEGD